MAEPRLTALAHGPGGGHTDNVLPANEPRIHLVGIDTPQAEDFVSSHPEGLGRWSFVLFKTRADVLDSGGRTVGEPGDCILLDPLFPHWHRGHHGPLRTDWLILVDDITELVDQSDIPMNQLIRPSTSAHLTALMAAMVGEDLRRQRRWRERVSLLFRDLLLMIERGLHETTSGAHRPVAEQLGKLRQHVHSQLDHDWTIAEMAAHCRLSKNHFAARYRDTFGVSPLEDLLRARIRQAAILLNRGGHTVGDCARRVGFQDSSWFSRCFRARMGCSPTTYAREPRRLTYEDEH